MYGWLLVNHFIHWSKFDEIFDWLLIAAQKKGLLLEKKTNSEILSIVGGDNPELFSPKPDFILFWDKDIRLAKYLEGCGFRLFNTASAIEICDDKSLTHIALNNSGIKMPKTIVAPKTFERIGYTDYGFVEEAVDILKFPLILKECFGSFGQQVYLINNMEDLKSKIESLRLKPFMFQEFIRSSNGRDIRIQTVGRRVVTTMYRYSTTGNFIANVTNGAKMKKYDPDEHQVGMAMEIVDKLGLDFAGIDILFGKNGEPVLCEVNSNAHFKNIYDCTGVNTADYIVDYIIDKMYKHDGKSDI